MSYISDNISLIRANTVSTAFDPYLLDNGSNKQNVWYSIEVGNK